MDAPLKRLIEKMPPPSNPPGCKVEWEKLESAIGLSFPTSFKEFIGQYGGCVWCDHASPFFVPAKTEIEVKNYLKSVKEKLKPLEGNMYDKGSGKIAIPLYPEKGGLFPFMIDYSSSLYCWRTEDKNPSKWPIVCWFTGDLVVLEKMTIAKMFLEWLDRKPHMVALWGDIDELPSDRIRLSF